MLGAITPNARGVPQRRKLADYGQWAAFLMSYAIVLGAFLVADTYRRSPRLSLPGNPAAR